MRITSFNPVARSYTDLVSPHRYSQFLALIHELRLEGNEKVLDIGADPGIMSMEIARRLRRSGHLSGIDLSPNMVRLARRNSEQAKLNNVSFIRGDALNLKFADNSFDIVVSSNAFPWVPDRGLFLQEVHRVLKPGGTFALVALSKDCYREFSRVLRQLSQADIRLFPDIDPFEVMGARLHRLNELARIVKRANFDVFRSFQLSTVEPILAEEYIKRINAIVNENYLAHLKAKGRREQAKRMIHEGLSRRNGGLKITESSVFVFANKRELVA